jgi:hypothetical protein
VTPASAYPLVAADAPNVDDVNATVTSAVPFVRTNSTTPAASVVPVIEEVPLNVPVPTRVAITEIPEIPLPKRSVTVAVTRFPVALAAILLLLLSGGSKQFLLQ